MMFDGTSMIAINGEVKAITSQFTLRDEVVSAVVDLDEVISHRSGSARRMQAIKEPRYPSIPLDVSLTSKGEDVDPAVRLSATIDVKYLEPEAEISLGPAAWLPLSGGIDSASTAVIVYSMCRMVAQNVESGNKDVIQDLRRICGEPHGSEWLPTDPKEICNILLHTCYMGSENSSQETRQRARDLATSIGSFHFNADIDEIVAGFTRLFKCLWGFDLSKLDLRRFIKWATVNLDLSVLSNFLSATPVAELVPLSAEMTDEEDMGLTYDELSIFGRLRYIIRATHFVFELEMLILERRIERLGHDLRPILYPALTWAYDKCLKVVERLEGATTTALPSAKTE
ncbi:MAG: hypothetical protein Q9217_000885 [Psora testacea]